MDEAAVIAVLTTVLLAAPSGWQPVPAKDAQALIARLAALEGATEAARWKALEPLLAEPGVYAVEDTTPRSDDQPPNDPPAWLQPAALAPKAGLIVELATLEPVCVDSVCRAAASHFETSIALRRGADGVRIVGLLETDALVTEGRALEVEGAQARWAAEIAERYGPGDSDVLPPVAASPPSPAARRASDAQNSAGYALSKAGDHAGAAARYRQAVRLDPSNVVARYNLGCALNRLGKAEAARARLAELKAAGCPTCVGRLARARTDPDWESQWADPAFRDLTGDATVAPADPATVARAVEASFLKQQSSALTPWLPRRRPVRVRVTRRQDDAASARVMQVAGADLGAHLAGLIQGADAPAAVGFGEMTCAGACCIGKAPPVTKPTLVIERVCLRHDSAGVPILDRVELAERP